MLEDWQSWSRKLFTLSLFLGLQTINSCPILTSFFSQENLALIPYIIPPGGTIPQNRGWLIPQNFSHSNLMKPIFREVLTRGIFPQKLLPLQPIVSHSYLRNLASGSISQKSPIAAHFSPFLRSNIRKIVIPQRISHCSPLHAHSYILLPPYRRPFLQLSQFESPNLTLLLPPYSQTDSLEPTTSEHPAESTPHSYRNCPSL